MSNSFVFVKGHEIRKLWEMLSQLKCIIIGFKTYEKWPIKYPKQPRYERQEKKHHLCKKDSVTIMWWKLGNGRHIVMHRLACVTSGPPRHWVCNLRRELDENCRFADIKMLIVMLSMIFRFSCLGDEFEQCAPPVRKQLATWLWKSNEILLLTHESYAVTGHLKWGPSAHRSRRAPCSFEKTLALSPVFLWGHSELSGFPPGLLFTARQMSVCPDLNLADFFLAVCVMYSFFLM